MLKNNKKINHKKKLFPLFSLYSIFSSSPFYFFSLTRSSIVPRHETLEKEMPCFYGAEEICTVRYAIRSQSKNKKSKKNIIGDEEK